MTTMNVHTHRRGDNRSLGTHFDISTETEMVKSAFTVFDVKWRRTLEAINMKTLCMQSYL